MSNYKDSFTKTFVWNFPYFPKLESNETNSNAFIKQNILIFYLSYYFKIKNDNMESKLDKYIIGNNYCCLLYFLINNIFQLL